MRNRKKSPSVRGLLVLAALLLGQARAQAGELLIERIDLGEQALGEQSYNLQEQGSLRVFARSAAGFKRSRLFLQRRSDEGRWASPEALPFSDARWRDSDPHLSADARILTFVSDRPSSGETPLPQLDLYESRWVDGRWSAPQRLSEAWQSPAYELGPERYGEQLFLASARPGGPGKLAIYRADAGDVLPLPAPVNQGPHNSDFSLSPDGRYALWWSDRDGPSGGAGDIYLAERVGQRFGPALRLPAPINGPDFEFTPSVSADGQWLYFASTRGERGGLSALSHAYRVRWPELLQSLGAAAQAFSQAALDAEVSALWRAIGHGPSQPSDVGRLAAIFHPQARVYGQRLRDSSLGLDSWGVTDFLALFATPGPRGLFECEIQREQRRYGAHAQVYSVVQTRREPGQARASYTGVNSMQWQLGPQGWQLLALHYALELPGLPLPTGSAESAPCIG